MRKFEDIYALAAKRKGGDETLEALLPSVLTKSELSAKGNDRYLAMMCKAINQAGFSWKVIERKWPEFEEAFFGFDLSQLCRLTVEDWQAYTQDRRVVRNGQKIMAMAHNVQFVAEIVEEHGSFGQFIADWPESDQIGLLTLLKKRGSRLGGQTAQWFLRYVGKDGFVITKDVILCIQRAGVDIADKPTSKRDLTAIQDIFNEWHNESGRPYGHLSKIAAYSIGANNDPLQIAQEMRIVSDPE